MRDVTMRHALRRCDDASAARALQCYAYAIRGAVYARYERVDRYAERGVAAQNIIVCSLRHVYEPPRCHYVMLMMPPRHRRRVYVGV